ncbi:MAG: hypothetical protein ACR2PB_12895 [Desulfocapsaceae bacterium]
MKSSLLIMLSTFEKTTGLYPFSGRAVSAYSGGWNCQMIRGREEDYLIHLHFGKGKAKGSDQEPFKKPILFFMAKTRTIEARIAPEISGT